MKKVMLILPSKGLYTVCDEQGIALIASYLRKLGFEVFISNVSCLEQIDRLDFFDIEIVGITAYHDNLPFIYEMSEKIKEKNEKAIICLGGYSATYYAEEILNDCHNIDFIMEGEGEITFGEICEKVRRGIDLKNQRGIVYKSENGEIIHNERQKLIEDLSKMPHSAKDIFIKNNLSLVQISTSRGCFNNCSFCYSHSYFDPTGKVRWRGRRVEDVVDEVIRINSQFKVNKYYFNNASFEDGIPFKSFMIEFCKRIIENQCAISFCVNFRASFYRFCTKEEIELLKEAGLTGVFLGVESFNEADLKLYNKHASVNDNLNSLQFFSDYGIGIDMGFINLNPYSTVDSLRENAVNLYKTNYLCSLVFLNRLRGYKGTPIYNKMDRDGLIRKGDYLDYYCYDYINGDVGDFAEFINGIFVDEYQAISGDMYYFTMYHNQLVSHLKNRFSDESALIELVDEYDEQRKILLNEANEFCFEWYMSLIVLLQNGWDRNKAREILNQYNVTDKMLSIDNRLKVLFSKYRIRMSKMNSMTGFYIK